MRMLTIGEIYFLDNDIFKEYDSVLNMMFMETLSDDLFGLPLNYNVDAVFLKECANLESIIQNPDLLKVLIKSFVQRRLDTYRRLLQTTIQEYNMIHNFDRNEEYSDEITGTATGNNTTNETGSGTGKQENKSATFQNPVHLKIADQIENTANNTTERTDETSQTTTTNVKHTAHLFGNIGVTTTQQMLNEERELLKFDFLTEVVNEFKKEFCILVY